MNNINTKFLNEVEHRFLPLPRSAVEELEHEPNISDFDIGKQLGIGSYGKVYLVRHKKTKAEFALKIINKLDKINQEEKSYFNREIEIMYKLNHPNIVKLYGHFEDNKNCYILMQYIPNGSAYDLIPKNGKKQENFQLVASIMKDLINAIYYLHNMNPRIIHRDIKPENILLDENNKPYLIDFGWSNYIINNRRRYSVCGTPFYLSPEMVNETGHDEKVDIWCIGVLLYELTTGKVPFEGTNIDEVRNSICSLNINWPLNINPDAKDLIIKILKENPNNRLTIEKILNHNFFKNYFPNAINELIKPNNIKYKIFVISKDDPKTWNQPKNNQNSDLAKENNIIKKTKTMVNYKLNYELSPLKCTKNDSFVNKINNNKNKPIINNNINKNNNNNSSNNIVTISNNIIKSNINLSVNRTNHYITKYKANKKIFNNTNQNQFDLSNCSNRSTNCTIFHKSNSNYKNNYGSKNNNSYNITYNENNNNKYHSNSFYKKNNNSIDKNKSDKFSILLKKYDSLKKEFDNYKLKEIQKLKEQLKNINLKINHFLKHNKSCDFSKNSNIIKINELKNLYEKLKIENNELKEKIKNYSSYFANDVFLNNNDIVKEKEKQVNKYKEKIKSWREKEKERFSLLINKYDRTLIYQERENEKLKIKLKELERKF